MGGDADAKSTASRQDGILDAARDDHDRKASITNFMRAPVETVRRTAPLEAVLDRLHGPEATALAITDPEGVLIGLLTARTLPR